MEDRKTPFRGVISVISLVCLVITNMSEESAAQARIGDRTSPETASGVAELTQQIEEKLLAEGGDFDSRPLIDDLVLLAGSRLHESGVMASVEAISNRIVRDQKLWSRIDIEDQVRMLHIQERLPVYWHGEKMPNEAVASHADAHIDRILQVSERLHRARRSLPVDPPPIERSSVAPRDARGDQVADETERNIVIVNDIARIEEMRERFDKEAPVVLARFLLFSKESEAVLDRIRSTISIKREVYTRVRAEYEKLLMLTGEARD